VQASSPELLAERFEVGDVRVDDHQADYNVAPRASVPVVRQRDGKRVLSQLQWGLVPWWAKDPKIGDRLINARAETILDKPAYQRAFLKRRCIIPADGFYEWMTVSGNRGKQPMFVHRTDGEPMAFAGLWEAWRDPSGDRSEGEERWLRSCAIVTTTANGTVAPIHDRMPVILPRPTWTAWLDPDTEPDAAHALLVPAPDDDVVTYPVGTAVNSADNNGPELVRRVEMRSQPRLV
jgi:putative SOS response-associated peptidase YedK